MRLLPLCWGHEHLLAEVLAKKDVMSAAADIYEEFMRCSEGKHGMDSPKARRWRQRASQARDTSFDRQVDESQSMTIQEAQEEFESTVAELGHVHHSSTHHWPRCTRDKARSGSVDAAMGGVRLEQEPLRRVLAGTHGRDVRPGQAVPEAEPAV